jgi:hypothetical protein
MGMERVPGWSMGEAAWEEVVVVSVNVFWQGGGAPAKSLLMTALND